jgi:hypothetical protein
VSLIQEVHQDTDGGQAAGEPLQTPHTTRRPSAVSFTVPGRPVNLSNRRMHWAARARLVRDRRGLVRLLAQSALATHRLPAPTGRRTATAEIRLSGVLFDPDGAVSALKADLDGLVSAGLLAGDRVEDVELSVNQVRVPRGEQAVVWTVSGDWQ